MITTDSPRLNHRDSRRPGGQCSRIREDFLCLNFKGFEKHYWRGGFQVLKLEAGMVEECIGMIKHSNLASI